MPNPLQDLHRAQIHIRRGAIAAYFVAGLGFLVTTIAILSRSSGTLALFNDPWGFVDVFLAFALAFGIQQHSRVASGLFIIYYLFTRIYLWTEWRGPGVLGLLVTCAFLYFFINAFRGCIAYHRIRRRLDPDYRPSSPWVLALWIPVAGLAVAVVFFSLVAAQGPPTAVVNGESLTDNDHHFLYSNGILDSGEKVDLFYSAGIRSIAEDGNLITPTRVVSYETINDELAVYTAAFHEIDNIEIEETGSTFSDTVVLITRTDGEGFYLLLSTENQGDQRFLDVLKRRWRASEVPTP